MCLSTTGTSSASASDNTVVTEDVATEVWSLHDHEIPLDIEVNELAPELRGQEIRDFYLWGDDDDDNDDDHDERHTMGRASTNLTVEECLVESNVELLLRLLKMIVACRNRSSKRRLSRRSRTTESITTPSSMETPTRIMTKTVIDEVTDTINVPSLDMKTTAITVPSDSRINKQIAKQLRDLVSAIASLYRDNPFHNFEHASHVALSAHKLLQRMRMTSSSSASSTSSVGDSTLSSLTPDVVTKNKTERETVTHLHNLTFGIASDPLIQFAIVFSALIHDVDHLGVPNFVLIIENEPVAAKYKNKSVAEQNSLDLSWSILMQPKYDDLRCCICSTNEDARRFRQMVVNLVIATDIFDKDLSEKRRNRWAKAFHVTPRTAPLSMISDLNRKAAIMIEHILQAADVSHCMQHWHVYKKWNRRLFRETYPNHRSGRISRNPAEGWYQGEISFFDNYVLPLAYKLKTCGVFGVSGEEYLNYAFENKRKWALEGRELVAAMVAEAGDF